MSSWFQNIIERYQSYFRQGSFLFSYAFSFVAICVSLLVMKYAWLYAGEKASNSVTDIILDNIPVFNVEALFVYGPFVLIGLVVIFLMCRPNWFPFTVKSIALFILVRSLFISLTHLSPFPTHIVIPDHEFLYQLSSSGADLFFSGHTGLPFLMALIFWDNRVLRYFFIGASMLFGAVVLMGHLHYSIDVLAAYFITYSIFRMSELLFKQDFLWFKETPPHHL